jgi:hypothetical protein
MEVETKQEAKTRRSRKVSHEALYKVARRLVDEAYRRGYKAGLKSRMASIAAYKAHSTRRKNAS